MTTQSRDRNAGLTEGKMSTDGEGYALSLLSSFGSLYWSAFLGFFSWFALLNICRHSLDRLNASKYIT